MQAGTPLSLSLSIYIYIYLFIYIQRVHTKSLPKVRWKLGGHNDDHMFLYL